MQFHSMKEMTCFERESVGGGNIKKTVVLRFTVLMRELSSVLKTKTHTQKKHIRNTHIRLQIIIRCDKTNKCSDNSEKL